MRIIIIFLAVLLSLINVCFAQNNQDALSYNDQGRRDPFFPLVDEKGKFCSGSEMFFFSDKLRLSGVLWDPAGRSTALINDQMVQVGEVINGFELKAVAKDSITVSKDGKDYTICLSVNSNNKEE